MSAKTDTAPAATGAEHTAPATHESLQTCTGCKKIGPRIQFLSARGSRPTKRCFICRLKRRAYVASRQTALSTMSRSSSDPAQGQTSPGNDKVPAPQPPRPRLRPLAPATPVEPPILDGATLQLMRMEFMLRPFETL